MALVNSYIFRGDATDKSGSANGTLAGTTTPANQEGYLAGTSSYYFTSSGTGDLSRCDFARTTFQYTGATPFSWEMWFKSSKADATLHSLMICRDSGVSYFTGAIALYISDTEVLQLYMGGGGAGNLDFTGTTNVCDGLWHHVVLVYDGSDDIVMYLDGNVEGTKSATVTLGSSDLYTANSKFSIAAAYYHLTTNYYYGLTGNIGYFGNWNEALTARAVKDLFMRGKKRTY